MTRSITLKWIGTLVLSSLVGVVLIGLFAYRTTVFEYDRLRTVQSRDAFLEDIAQFYMANNSWNGVGDWLDDRFAQPVSLLVDEGATASSGGADGLEVATPAAQPDSSASMPVGEGETAGPYVPPASGFMSPYFDSSHMFAIADTSGQIVYGEGPFHVGDTVSTEQLESGEPIMINGSQVGVAITVTPPPGPMPREQEYLARITQALVIGAIGACAAAIVFGILLSQRFLRPLEELTAAISAMRQGSYDQKVKVRTRDELGVLAEAFNQMSAEIHRANQLRRQMTADIAHDLRTPLNVISGYLEAMRDGTLKPTQERFDAMNQEALLLRHLVDDLRTLSLADAGELKLVYQTVQPRELLEQVRQSFEPLAHEKQITLKVEADALIPDISLDRARMTQVLENLIGNALRHTPAGGSVILGVHHQAGGVQITVSDTGEGISEDKLPNIFERFYRTDESRSEDQGASGLGLAIAKSIVEAHHSTITAESKVGVGTSMIITIPAAAAGQ